MDLPLCTALSSAALCTAHQFDPQGLANTLWAFATLLVPPSEELMECLSQQVLRRCPEYDPQNCANTMWAYAVLVVGDSPVIAALSKRATEVISEFACQSLANTAWSLANLSVTDDQLLSSIEVQVESLISHFDSSDHSEKELLEFSMGLLGFFWAFAFLEVSCELHSRGRALLAEIGQILDRNVHRPHGRQRVARAGVGRQQVAGSLQARQHPHLLT